MDNIKSGFVTIVGRSNVGKYPPLLVLSPRCDRFKGFYSPDLDARWSIIQKDGTSDSVNL